MKYALLNLDPCYYFRRHLLVMFGREYVIHCTVLPFINFTTHCTIKNRILHTCQLIRCCYTISKGNHSNKTIQTIYMSKNVLYADDKIPRRHDGRWFEKAHGYLMFNV